MANNDENSRELFRQKSAPLLSRIQEGTTEEGRILKQIEGKEIPAGPAQLTLAKINLGITSCFLASNQLSLSILGVKQLESLNQGRLTLYKALVYLETAVSTAIDIPLSDEENPADQIASVPYDERYRLIQNFAVITHYFIDSFAESQKSVWTFVDLEGRFAVAAKNTLDVRRASRKYLAPDEEYNTVVSFINLTKKLLNRAAGMYRGRFTDLDHTSLDDLRRAIAYLRVLIHLNTLTGDNTRVGELKKRLDIWESQL
jgi:hypothetical protein